MTQQLSFGKSNDDGIINFTIEERNMIMTPENNLGITDSVELAKAEEKISKKKIDRII